MICSKLPIRPLRFHRLYLSFVVRGLPSLSGSRENKWCVGGGGGGGKVKPGSNEIAGRTRPANGATRK